MKMKTVAILGAGAIGGYFIWGLTEKLEENLWIIAEGERKERLERDGIVINGKKYVLNVRTPEEAHGADLLLVSTKYGALRGSLDAIEKIVDEHTTVLSLLNGVDSEEIISERIGKEHMLYSMMKISAERKGNSVNFNGEVTPGVYYGEAGQKEPSARMLAIADLLEGTPLHYHMQEDIIRDLWFKFALNISYNLPQAILSVGFGAYADSEYVARLSDCLNAEVETIAAAKGIDITAKTTEGKPSQSVKTARYSTLQDLDAKRHTEVDMFSGAIVRMGKELNIPTPYNEFAYCAIKALEEKNDGKFDY